MIMPSPVRAVPRPRRQRVPLIITATVGVVALTCVLVIALAVGSPSAATLPVGVSPLATIVGGTTPPALAHLRRQFPVPSGARDVSATKRSRTYTAPGGLPHAVRFYERRLHRIGVGWHPVARTMHGRRIAYAGALREAGARPRARLTLRRGGARTVRIRVVFRA
jgi:hypothetical protein